MELRDIREYLMPFVFQAAVNGGKAIMELYATDTDYDITLKSDKSPLTTADKRAHNTIKETLGPTRIPILSEEGREMEYDERRNWELFWLVDPLDGTVEFINNNNEFTVNIALVYHNEVVAGVIYIPYYNKLYFANRGTGAYVCNDIPLDTNPYEYIMAHAERLPKITEPRDIQRVAISRSHTTPQTMEHIERLRAENPSLEIVKQGSSYKFCMLAEGEVDYYVRTTMTYEWDTAAGEIILSEAGGSTSALDGKKGLLYNKENPQNPNFCCRSSISRL